MSPLKELTKIYYKTSKETEQKKLLIMQEIVSIEYKLFLCNYKIKDNGEIETAFRAGVKTGIDLFKNQL